MRALPRLILGVLAIVCLFCVADANASTIVTGLGFCVVGMALDATLVSELDKDWAIGLTLARQGAQAAAERLRAAWDQSMVSSSAAITSVMLQASLPEQAMSSKLADRTPASPAMSEPPNPQTVVAAAK